MCEPENEESSNSVQRSERFIADAGQSAEVEKPSHHDDPRNACEPGDTAAAVLQQRKSSGPRTRHGKARASRNSLKYGFLSKEVVIHSHSISEDPEEFKQLLQCYIKEYQPTGPFEFHQVEIAVTALWRYRRALKMEFDFHDEKVFKSSDEKAELMEIIRKGAFSLLIQTTEYSGDAPSWAMKERGLDPREVEEESRQQKIEAAKVTRAWQIVEEVCAQLTQEEKPKTRENAMRCESSHLRTYYRALNELERRQRMRRGDHVPAPVVVSLDDNGTS